MDRAGFSRRIFPILCGAGLLFVAWAQPVSAQASYTCPPGYYYAEPASCVPSGYDYGQPDFYGPSYDGSVPFGFVSGFHGGFGHRDFGREGFGRGGFGHEAFGHGGGGSGHGGGHR